MPFLLAPTHNLSDTRPLPLPDIGRNMLAPWYWNACKCQGVMTRTPCSNCKLLGRNIATLSRKMFSIDANGLFTMDRNNVNSEIIKINGKVRLRRAYQLQEGDEISIGRYESLPWMTLLVLKRQPNAVTPEKGANKLPLKKRIQQRLAGSNDNKRSLVSWLEERRARKKLCLDRSSETTGTTRKRGQQLAFSSSQESQSSQQSVLVPDPKDNDSPARPRKRPRHNESAQSVGESVTESVTADQGHAYLDGYAPGKRFKAWNVGESSSEISSQNLVPPRQPSQKGEKSSNSSNSSNSSSSGRPTTQQPEGEGGDDSPGVLSLPQCPTYQGDDSDKSDRQQTAPSPELQKDGSSSRSSRDDWSKQDVVLASDLTTQEWRMMQQQHRRSFPQAMANLVLAQRVRRKDDKWLPGMLQRTAVDARRSL